MHKFILFIFEALRNVEKFIRVVCLFFIMFLSLYWIENLIDASWWWMKYINPVLGKIVDFANTLCSFSFDFWGKTMEVKYFVALLVVVSIILVLKVFDMLLNAIQNMYEDAHYAYKKISENAFNKSLYNEMKSEEKKLTRYTLFFRSELSKKYSGNLKSADIKEHNEQIKKFLTKKINSEPIETWDGYLYYLNNFEKVDEILELLFKIKNTKTPFINIFCIQIGTDTKKLKQLADLNCKQKIIMLAETQYRYEFNSSHQYKITNVGVFQKDDSTFEVYEFEENL